MADARVDWVEAHAKEDTAGSGNFLVITLSVHAISQRSEIHLGPHGAIRNADMVEL